MLTSLEQLCKHYKISNHQFNRIQVVCRPQQKNYVSLVQWFGDNKLLVRDFDISNFNQNHRLCPYGKNTFGMYPMAGYELYDNIGNLNTTWEEDRTSLGVPLCIIKFNTEEYTRAKDEHHKFWEWRNNRNPTRLAMEEEFNFDGKFAMHLVRLLRMGAEALETGVLNVKRPDAAELLEIRNGAWTYDELVKYAEDMDKHVREVLYKKTKLPRSPDIHLAAKVLMKIQDIVWNQTQLNSTPY